MNALSRPWSYPDVNLFNWPDANLCISVGPVHMTMGAIAYWSALVCSKKLVGREVAFTQVWKNPANRCRIGLNFEWYRKVNQKSGQFTKVPFHSLVNRKRQVHFPDLLGFYKYMQVDFTY